MENLPGPQDGGKAIQQNNGLLCPALLSLSQDFSATSASSGPTHETLHPNNENPPFVVVLSLFFFQSG